MADAPMIGGQPVVPTGDSDNVVKRALTANQIDEANAVIRHLRKQVQVQNIVLVVFALALFLSWIIAIGAAK